MASETAGPSAWVIVLNWNGRSHLPDCLGALAAVPSENVTILLVDNGSTDGSVEWVETAHPEVKLLRNSQNLGFTGGNNAGIRYALDHGADYVILLNNDTSVDPSFVERLVAAGESDPSVGVIGGTIRMFYNPDVVNSTGVDLNMWAYGRDRDFGAPSSAKRPEGDVLAVSGCLMAVKRRVFEEIGLLDDAFFAYFEDVDFCLRVWDETDFRILYTPEALIYHKFSASTAGNARAKALLYTRNQYRLMLKHFRITHLWRTAPGFLLHRWHHLVEGKKALSQEVSWLELLFMARFVGGVAVLPLTRLARALAKGPKRQERFWPMLVPEACLPREESFHSDHTKKVASAREAALVASPTRRLTMGVNDFALSGDWSVLGGEAPRRRSLMGRAACFLEIPEGESYLQVHAFADTAAAQGLLWAFVDGSGWGCRRLRPGWCTYHYRIDSRAGGKTAEVALEARNAKGAGLPGRVSVNEVAALSPGDPFLRAGGLL